MQFNDSTNLTLFVMNFFRRVSRSTCTTGVFGTKCVLEYISTMELAAHQTQRAPGSEHCSHSVHMLKAQFGLTQAKGWNPLGGGELGDVFLRVTNWSYAPRKSME